MEANREILCLDQSFFNNKPWAGWLCLLEATRLMRSTVAVHQFHNDSQDPKKGRKSCNANGVVTGRKTFDLGNFQFIHDLPRRYCFTQAL
jgi:hypothetical protein